MTDLLAPAPLTDPVAAEARATRAPGTGPSLDRRDPTTGLVSCLYEGTLDHARLGAVPHEFSASVAMAWLALEELPGALDAHPLWSARGPAPVRYRRADFHGPEGVPLDDAVRDTVAEATGRRPEGPVRLLAHLRTWGWSFNPIAFYVVLTPDRLRVDTMLAEVTNTPWHERHPYVLPIDAPDHLAGTRFPKALHVSPFLDMDLDHVISFTAPGADDVTICMDDRRGDEKVFAATLRLNRRPLDRPTMGGVLRRHPAPAQRISAGIYREALKLRAKGAPFRRHPKHDGAAVAPTRTEHATAPTVDHPVRSTP